MKWCISKGVDGVITDDPKKYLEVLKDYDGGKVKLSWRIVASIVWLNFLVVVFGPLFHRRARGFTEKEQERRRLTPMTA